MSCIGLGDTLESTNTISQTKPSVSLTLHCLSIRSTNIIIYFCLFAVVVLLFLLLLLLFLVKLSGVQTLYMLQCLRSTNTILSNTATYKSCLCRSVRGRQILMQTIGQTKRRTHRTDIIMALVRELGLQMLTIAQTDKAERMTPVLSLVKLSKISKHVALRPQMM